MNKDPIEEAFSDSVSTERALDLALEALEPMQNSRDDTAIERAITAIKQARSAPYVASPQVQEPFGYVYEVYCLPECACEMEWVEIFDRYEPDAAENIRNVTPVYTTPPNVATPLAAQRPVAEPHKWVHATEWRGLTDEEFEDIELGCLSTVSGKIMAMQKVEAKLKEKNSD